MTGDEFRALTLSLNGVVERAHMGHPDFRVNGKIFATLHGDDQWGMIKLSPEEQREFIRGDRETFVPSSGAWGRQGCTNVRLATAHAATVRAALLLAWERTASQKRTLSQKTALDKKSSVRRSTAPRRVRRR